MHNNRDEPPPTYNEAIGISPNNSLNISTTNTVFSYPESTNSNTQDQQSSQQPSHSNYLFAGTPTLISRSPHNFEPERDVTILNHALSTSQDKDILIKILCHRTYHQRNEIAQLYYCTVERQLIKDIKKSCSSSFCKLMSGLTIPYHEYLARTVHNSSSFKWLYYILFTLSSYEINEMSTYFRTKYGSSITSCITRVLNRKESGPEKFLLKPLLRLLANNRHQNNFVDEVDVLNDVRSLEGIVGGIIFVDKNEKQIIKDFCYNKSFNHIRRVCEVYTSLHPNKTITEVFARAYSATNYEIFENICSYSVEKNKYFAFVLKKSMKGLGTDDDLLMHVILWRCELDLVDITNAFNLENKSTLREWVRDDTSGYFKYGLYALMGEQRSSNIKDDTENLLTS